VEKCNLLDELFAFCKFELCVFVVRLFLAYGLEVAKSFSRIENGGVCDSSSPVCLKLSAGGTCSKAMKYIL